jgi:glycosyltransferase involved in cell wall biosynthesis
MKLELFEGVSVCIFTFNYEKYLSQAIESVLNQTTDFPVEIVIGDDCSTDSTREIALHYKRLYPDKVVISFNDQNLGGTRNWVNTINRCRGKYVSLLDGDDYFIDNSKLQTQYDLLRKNAGYALCIHSVEERYDNRNGQDKVVEFTESEFTLVDIFSRGWFMRTSSLFFRNGLLPQEPPVWVYDFPYRYDTIMQVFLCQHGNAANIKRAMSVWRKHDKGMSFVLLEDFKKNANKEIELMQKLNEHTGYKYTKEATLYTSNLLSGVFLQIVRNMKVFSYPRLFLFSLTKMNYKYTIQMVKQKLIESR